MAEKNLEMRDPVVIAAFEGWNDAADAATEVINHLAEMYPTETLFDLESDDYYDYQTTRPRIALSADGRYLEWPTTRLSVCHMPHRDALLVGGPEPNLRWQQFCSTLIESFNQVKPSIVIILGAMLTDTPHTRPLPVSASSTDSQLIKDLGLEPSDYEGPIGIVGVLADACSKAGFRSITLWASVPHYVATPPNPKATLALLNKVEDVLDDALDQGELVELTRAWQRGVDSLAEEDPDVATYIQDLEEQQDSEELPTTTADSLAAEAQRFLRRRDDNQ